MEDEESQQSRDGAQGNATESEGSPDLWNGPRWGKAAGVSAEFLADQARLRHRVRRLIFKISI